MRKGQAAIEFLMTYGWAILVVLVVIGALGYFGVLNPTALLPEKCVFGVELSCQDYALHTNKIELRLQNNVGTAMIITKAAVVSDDKVTALCGTTLEGTKAETIVTGQTLTLQNSQVGTYTIKCETNNLAGKEGQKTRLYVNVWYKKGETGLEHKIEGDLFAIVQK